MNESQLIELLDGDKFKAKRIIEVTKDVLRFTYHRDALGIGIVFGPNDIPFSDILLFSWIKEGLSGRKN